MIVESLDQRFEECKQELDQALMIDQKLMHAIEFMKEALSNGRKARFRDFWRMKKVCLELFKSEIHRAKRTVFWSEYTALLSQAHALQRIIEEQTNFQAEQIELAIKSLEEEKEEIEVTQEERDLFSKIDKTDELARLHKMSLYTHSERQQALSLRKEILKLEIRISQKNKLLGRLSKVCDRIFPKRKAFLLDLTKAFSRLVDEFIQIHFDLSEKKIKTHPTFYHLREKIKAFQVALKELTISNEAYGRIRSQLGDCWDLVSAEEKELKKKSSLKKQEMLKSEKVEEEKKKKEKEEEAEKKSRVSEALEKLDSLKNKAKRMKLENVVLEYEKLGHSNDHFDSWDKSRIIFEVKKQFIEYIMIGKRLRLGEETEDELAILHKEIKQAIERMKHAKVGCGLDIEFALLLDELINEGKEIVLEIEEKL